jgi:hypothetical protein
MAPVKVARLITPLLNQRSNIAPTFWTPLWVQDEAAKRHRREPLSAHMDTSPLMPIGTETVSYVLAIDCRIEE